MFVALIGLPTLPFPVLHHQEDDCKKRNGDGYPHCRAALGDTSRRGIPNIADSMDRLARNITDLLHPVETSNKRSVVVEFVKEGLTFTGDDSAMSRLMLTIMGGVAEFERANDPRAPVGRDRQRKAGRQVYRAEVHHACGSSTSDP